MYHFHKPGIFLDKPVCACFSLKHQRFFHYLTIHMLQLSNTYYHFCTQKKTQTFLLPTKHSMLHQPNNSICLTVFLYFHLIICPASDNVASERWMQKNTPQYFSNILERHSFLSMLLYRQNHWNKQTKETPNLPNCWLLQ